MSTPERGIGQAVPYPVDVRVDPTIEDRDRLTTAFRLVLALPHLLLVGGPIALALSWTWSAEGDPSFDLGAAGVLGAVAAIVALIAWFSIIATGRFPQGLWDLAAYYLRWRVRAVAYTALLSDEYPPFGDGPYPASLQLSPPNAPRDRLTVAFRIILALPHILAVWALGVAWALTTVIAWFAILFTGRYPEGLYRFAVGVFRWNVRVEAYLLLLRDEYPPFSLE
jgi:hypothetical protein